MSRSNIFWRNNSVPHIEIRKTTDSCDGYRLHSHAEYLSIGAVDSGESVMTCDGESTVLCKGQLVFFNPGEMHSCNPAKGESRSYWMMHISKEWCLALQKEMFADVSGFSEFHTRILKDDSLFSEFCDICSGYLEENISEADEKFLVFMYEIIEKCCGGECVVKDSPVDKVREYIEMNLCNTLSLDSLADKFKANRFSLLRAFKRAYGLPPVAYQMSLRIDRAKEMLKNGIGIAETAYETGFSDQSHFHRIFREVSSATPGEYKNSVS